MAQNPNDAIIKDIESNGTTILATAGKYCDRNIEVNVNVPIPSGYIKPSGNKNITTNGTHDVTQYANAVVNVPIPDGYIKPSGNKTITENGTHDVAQYANAVVNVPIPSGYVKPSGSKTITENGTHDVTNFASAVVNVAGKPTQFTNLYDVANVTVKTRLEVSSNTPAYTTDNNTNVVKIPFHHKKGEPVVLRMRGIGTVRDRYTCVVYGSDGTTRVQHYNFVNSGSFALSYDEHGDVKITFAGGIIDTYEWYWLGFNFQYPSINSGATAMTGPIITINEPIGNGGHV